MKHWKTPLLIIGLVILLLLVYYSHSIINADHLTYGLWGDGYKNYYTLAYYLKYNSGIHFTGMNYPYGENIVFTDNQPVIAWILKLIAKVFPSITLHIHGYLAWVIFLSVVVSAVFLFKTLREFEVGEFQAILFAVLIAMMAPQLRRLTAHFSLGYTCFLPIFIFLLVKFFKSTKTFKVFIAMTVTITFFSFIHMYYTGMAAIFLLLISFFYAVVNYKQIGKVMPSIALLISAAAIPLFILKVFLITTDPITDRPKTPWGFIESRSTIADIFLSQDSFTGEIMGKVIPPGKLVYHGEGAGYIGLIATLTLFAFLLLVAIQKLRKKNVGITIPFPLHILLLAAIVVLLFAMAFPFCIDPLEKYYNYLPGTIKQFRASGRFNWIFYYVSTLFSAVFIYQLFNKLIAGVAYRWIAYSLLALVYSVWFIEINMTSVRLAREFSLQGQLINEDLESHSLLAHLRESGKTPNSFQAIFPIPFFLNGSEKLYLESSSAFPAMKASLFTGLPLTGGQMSRTSESQTFKLANLISNDLVQKAVIKEYPTEKPLLLMAIGGYFNEQQQKIINRAKYLFTVDDIRYFELPLSAFKDKQDSIKKYFSLKRSAFHQHGDYQSMDSTENVVVRRFEDNKVKYAVFGEGAWHSEHDNAYLFFDTLPGAKDSSDYEFSIWLYADNRRPAFPVIYLREMDEAGKEVVQAETQGKLSTNTFGKWVRVDIPFPLYSRKNKVYVAGEGDFASYDELMIRPKNEMVISAFKNDSTFMFNSFPLR
jgi:hypothetical protein